MKVLSNPPKNSQIHAYLLFYFICNVQIGVGIFNFERYIFETAKHDAWISVILAGLVAHLFVWFIVRALHKYESTDLYGIHFDMYGKVIGTVFNCIYMLYYLCITIIIMRNYIEVIQGWIFPDISSWVILALISLLIIFAGFGGLRVIVGMCLLGFIVIIFTMLLFHSSLEYAIWSQLLPVLETKTANIIDGAIRMSFSLAGFEIILFIYPFVVNKERAMLHSQLAVGFANLVYLIIMVLSIVYFSSNQLERSIWPSINMLKIVKYPFLERLEFIVVSVWMLVVITGILINTWVVTRGFKRMWNLNQKATLVFIIALAMGVAVTIKGHETVDQVNKIIGMGSLAFSFVYPFLLSLLVLIVFKFRGRRRSNKKGGSQ
ncbi:GerAB/ArcD/ProY family transporter [Paenibacillus dakarensis]|uniref:GerAB/ArcD/ProY family transporter n=1 Tax=Paenibacillus dakarensis TaxID=1527293 RepID=UPI0006D5742B|nr:GerAB/ArcD/ProY family transporter [Paenibacillus dakarensis]